MSEPASRPRRIALTGGIATGKSHVRAEFERLGVPTIDADVLAREAVAPGTPALAAIAERFGRDLIDSQGALDRRKLACSRLHGFQPRVAISKPSFTRLSVPGPMPGSMPSTRAMRSPSPIFRCSTKPDASGSSMR